MLKHDFNISPLDNTVEADWVDALKHWRLRQQMNRSSQHIHCFMYCMVYQTTAINTSSLIDRLLFSNAKVISMKRTNVRRINHLEQKTVEMVPEKLIPFFVFFSILLAIPGIYGQRGSTTQVSATDGKPGSLTLRYYLTSAADLHYAIVQNGTESLDALQIKNGILTEEVSAVRGSVVVEKAQRVTKIVHGLDPGRFYDVYFVAEASGSNGVFGKVAKVENAKTHEKPLRVDSIVANPVNGSTTSLNVTVHVDGTGLVHVAICNQFMDVEKILNIESWENQMKNCRILSELVEEASVHLEVQDLNAGGQFAVYSVGEAMKSGGIIGQVFALDKIASTFNFPPALTNMRFYPTSGTVDELTLYFEVLLTDVMAKGSSKEDIDSPVFHLHYALFAEGTSRNFSSFKEIQEFQSDDTGNCFTGTLSRNNMKDASTAKAKMELSKSINVKHANTTFTIFMVVETPDSGGVYAMVDYTNGFKGHNAKTHAKAPMVGFEELIPCNGSTNCLQLSMNLSNPGILHTAMVSKATELRIGSVTQFFEMQKEADQHENSKVQWISVIAHESTFEYQNLQFSTEYALYYVLETQDSFGVYSNLFSNLRAKTNDLPPTISLLSLEPKHGTVDSATAVLKYNDAVLVHYSVHSVTNELIVHGNQECNNRFSDVPYVCDIALTNLTSGTEYIYSMKTETTQHVFGGWHNEIINATGTTQLFLTYQLAPKVFSANAIPVNASSTQADVNVVAQNKPGVVHSFLIPVNLQRHEDVTMDNLKQCALAISMETHAQVQNNISRNDQLLPDSCRNAKLSYQYFLNIKSIEKTTLRHTNLQPNVTYDIVTMTETLESEGVFGYFTNDSVTRNLTAEPDILIMKSGRKVTTHPVAPKILKMVATATNASTNSIQLFFEMDYCGTAHFNITDLDYKDPARISTSIVPSSTIEGIAYTAIFNGTCTGNVTIDGLYPDTTYYATAYSETTNSHGIFGLIYPPHEVSVVVSTHDYPPHVLELNVVPNAKDAIDVSILLSRYGFVHYAVLLREFNMTMSSQSSITMPPRRGENLTYELFPSKLPTESISGVQLQDASKNLSEILGSGVMANDTIDISRSDIEKGERKTKKIDKLLSGALYDFCYVVETADSNGLFGPVRCLQVKTYCDFNSIQNNLDNLEMLPANGSTSSLSVLYTMPKLSYWDMSPEVIETNRSNILTDLEVGRITGRIPFYAVSANHFTAQDSKSLLKYKNGDRGMKAVGKFNDVKSENDTFITFTQTINNLRENQKHTIKVVSQSFDERIFNESSDAHIYSGQPTEISPNTTAIASTHANAPELQDYSVLPAKGAFNALQISIKVNDQPNKPTAFKNVYAWVYAIVFKDACESHSSEGFFQGLISRARNNDTSFVGGCIAGFYRVLHTEGKNDRKLTFVVGNSTATKVAKKAGELEELWLGTLQSNTSYITYLTTESVGSAGVVGKILQPGIQARTYPRAPTLEHMHAVPRIASTTEMNITLKSNVPAHVHFVIVVAGKLNATCATPLHISDGHKYFSSSHNKGNCSDVKTETNRKIEISQDKTGLLLTEFVGHLSPGVMYDVFFVTQSWKSGGVLSEVTSFRNLTVFATAPILLSHGAHPTPGSAHSISIDYRVNTAGVVHFLVLMESNLKPIAQMSVEVGELHLDEEKTQIMHLPYPGTKYRIHMVTETTESKGVFGTIAILKNIQTHYEAPKATSILIQPTDAQKDSITLFAELNQPGNVYYFLMQGKSKQPSMEVAKQMIKSLQANVSSLHILQEYKSIEAFGNLTIAKNPHKGNMSIGDLREGTYYELYYVTESFASYGVLSNISTTAVSTSTHSAAPLMLEDVDCSLAPLCENIGREEVRHMICSNVKLILICSVGCKKIPAGTASKTGWALKVQEMIRALTQALLPKLCQMPRRVLHCIIKLLLVMAKRRIARQSKMRVQSTRV